MPAKTAWRVVLRWSLILLGLALLTLTFSCAIALYREEETLAFLLKPENVAQTTPVYSRWLDLRMDRPVVWERIVRWLEMAGYARVESDPSSVGQYRVQDSQLIIFVRPFKYPDHDYPAQRLRLEFRDRRLVKMTAEAGQAALEAWRLEPALLVEWSTQARTPHHQVRLAELPPYVSRAVVAMEDKRFFQHGAFDLIGIARALWVDLRGAKLTQGASTLSQQLARSIFLDVSRTARRKLLEAGLAVYLEARYSKAQLLEMYLNQVYWGQEGSDSLLGIEAVSRALFGKSARQLTIAESAMLAGMLQSPNRYSPRQFPQVARERRSLVLQLMRQQEFISEAQYKAALVEPLRLVPARSAKEASYVLAALRDQLAGQYSWTALISQGWRIFTTIDPLLQRLAARAVQPAKAEAALVAIEPASGDILAWVGGKNFATSPFDRAINAKRQPGSTFKTFVALAAIESHRFSTASILEDKPLTLKGIDGPWRPQNYDHKYRGNVTLWDSVVNSWNVPVVRLAMSVGLASVTEMARRAGIQSPLRDDLSVALGSSEVSVLELTSAYGTIANAGVLAEPHPLNVILSPDGRRIAEHHPILTQAFSPESAFIVTQMLQAVIDQGTGKAARALGVTGPVAGKTGTSENFQDAWFSGYTSSLACTVWVGYDKPRSLGHSAASIALPLWSDFMKQALVFYPPQEFAVPKGLTWKAIDVESGLLVKTGCTHRRDAAFVPGTQPTEDCPLHPGGIIGLFKRLKN